jgi:hypothetical protein
VSAWFRRRGSRHVEETEDLHEDIDEGPEQEQDEASGLSRRPEGPWDVSERPETEGLIDLGALRLRGVDGMQLRLDVEEASGSISTATVQIDGSALQLQVFAAPRTEGIWPEISNEIAAGIARQGGKVKEATGDFGRELHAQIPRSGAQAQSRFQKVRFIGVDGPRWLLRAVIHGAAAEDPAGAGELEALLREVVVVRGSQAMAPRDLLPLRLPQEAEPLERPADPGDESDQKGADPRPVIDPYRRGPEITETH